MNTFFNKNQIIELANNGFSLNTDTFSRAEWNKAGQAQFTTIEIDEVVEINNGRILLADNNIVIDVDVGKMMPDMRVGDLVAKYKDILVPIVVYKLVQITRDKNKTYKVEKTFKKFADLIEYIK